MLVADWVWRHYWHEPIAWARRLDTSGPPWDRLTASASAVFAYHNVWFGEDLITDPNTQVATRRHAAAL